MADNKMQFQEKLRGILSLAREKSGRLYVEDVEKYFEEENLTQAQMELVYDYLLSQKVAVGGYEKKGGTTAPAGKAPEFSASEIDYLKEYEHDLKAFAPAKEGEKEELFARAREHDALAKSRLIEIFLPFVVETAKEQWSPDVFLGDLVQEGNVSLMLALEMLPEKDEEAFLRAELVQSMQALGEEQREMKKRDQRMVEKVGELDESITKLTGEMGRKVTIEELAMFMDMSVEEIAAVMQLAGEEIEIPDADPMEVLHVAGDEMDIDLPDLFDDMEYKPGE